MGLFDSLKEQFFASSQDGNTRKSSGFNSGNNQPISFRISLRLIIGIILLLLIIVTVVTSIVMVDETEQSVVLRFGKYNRILEPGLSFMLPFGIEESNKVQTKIVKNMTFGFRTQRADIVSLRSRGDYSSESTMLTGDLNIVSVEWVIQYRITDPRKWLFNVRRQDDTIRDISISVMNELVGDYYITDILGNARTVIEETALVNLNDIFKIYNLGINVIAVQLQNIVPPEGSVQDAFEDVNKAIQDMNRLINEGREEYNKVIPKAKGQAEGIIQEAQGYAVERINRANGDASRFNSVLQEYRINPTITRERLYFETVEEILSNQSDTVDTRFIDSTFNNVLPLLQLNKNKGLQE